MSLFRKKLNLINKKREQLDKDVGHIQEKCPHNAGVYSALSMGRSPELFCIVCNKQVTDYTQEKSFVEENYTMIEGDVKYNRENRINIYEDTKTYVEVGGIKSKASTKKYTLDDIVEVGKKRFEFRSSGIETTDNDTISALKFYRWHFEDNKDTKYGRVCILNMASAKRPGGGVANGAQAQEECLFRCSDLFNTITPDLYPIKHDEAIYTENATFFKATDYSYVEKPMICDVVTIPALNLNSKAKYDDLDLENNYDKITKEKIDLMLNLCYQRKVVRVILGAWGCGVFKNDPEKMATLFKEVIDEKYEDIFDTVEFAVINDHNSVGNNYEIFKNILK